MVAQIDKPYLITRPTKVLSRLLSYAFFEGRPLTTRGRWINPLVFLQFSIVKRLPLFRPVEKPIFILGTGRSGTTVLGMVLSMHKDLAFLNEPKALWHAIYPNEDLIGSYSRGVARYCLRDSDATAEAITVAQKLYAFYLALVRSGRVVDKYPELVFRVPFVKALFKDAQFLFIVRNGWDTCCSIENWSSIHGERVSGEVHDWWGVNQRKWKLLVEQVVPLHDDLSENIATIAGFTRQTDMAAVEWIVAMREGFRLSQDENSNVFLVRFEDISRVPDESLSAISRMLGLDDDPVFLSYGKKILHPVDSVSPFDLHPVIQKPFAETMKMLGY